MRLHNYWWLIMWPLIFGALGAFYNMNRAELVEGRRVYRWRPLAAIILAVPYVVWAGWREGFGDTEQYRGTFLAMPSSLGDIIPYMQTVKKGYGFRLIELLFRCLISRSDIAFFVFVAAIQMACLIYMYRKYSLNYWLSIFFFVASTDYLSWMHNGIRQFLAATLVFLCIPLIAKNKYLSALVIIALAATIHVTVLIFVPIVFVVNGKTWNHRTLVFLGTVIIAVVFVDRITGFLTNALVDTAYEGDIAFLTNNDGTNIMRVLFYSVPAIMSMVFRPYFDRANDPVINVCANLSIVTAGFYVFSYFTSGILMGAIPIYFSLSNYILIPWILKEVFNKDSARILTVIFVSVYALFFYYQCGPTWGLL